MMDKKLSPRNTPVQPRARRQRDKILKVTAELLESIGVDELTTIRLAKAVGISVGTLYHYFPNKHAILHALAASWIDDVVNELKKIADSDLIKMPIKDFVVMITDRFEGLYTEHSPLLPQINALNTMPELNLLKQHYNQKLLQGFADIFIKLNICDGSQEAERLASVYCQLLQGLLLPYVESKSKSDKTLSDIKYLQYTLLERAKSDF
jgi:AcrR family transcriptional regulator